MDKPRIHEKVLQGEISLYADDASGNFYSGEVEWEDPFPAGFHLLPWWERPWIKNEKSEPHPIEVSIEQAVISGFYEDKYGAGLGEDTAYEVILTIWYEEDPEEKT